MDSPDLQSQVDQEHAELQKDLARAAEAQAILNNPIVQEALTSIKNAVLAKWVMSVGREKRKEREYFHGLYVHALSFEGILRGYLVDGTLAIETLKKEEERQSAFQKVKEALSEFWHFN